MFTAVEHATKSRFREHSASTLMLPNAEISSPSVAIGTITGVLPKNLYLYNGTIKSRLCCVDDQVDVKKDGIVTPESQ